MKRSSKESKNKILPVFMVLIFVVIILEIFELGEYVEEFSEIIISIILGIITTAVSRNFVQKISTGKLEKLFLKISIGGKKYSFSVFVLVTALVKRFIFNF